MSMLLGFLSRNLLRPMASSMEKSFLFGNQNATTNTSCYHLLNALRFKSSGGKTNRSAAKRFRIRSSGSLKRIGCGRSHNTGHKQRQRVNRLGRSTGVQGKKLEQNIRKLLGAY